MTSINPIPVPDNTHATTHIIGSALADGNVKVSISTMLDANTGVAHDVVVPAEIYSTIMQTGRDVAAAIVERGTAHNQNPDASNALTATQLVLLNMKSQGLNAAHFFKGQPSFEILVKAAQDHIAQPHIPQFQAMMTDIVNYVSSKREQVASRPAAHAL